MLRRILREGIRDVAAGKNPRFLSLDSKDKDKVYLTYSSDTVIRSPQKGSKEEDVRFMHELGRKVAIRLLEEHPDRSLVATAPT